jgi:hypothetical protein
MIKECTPNLAILDNKGQIMNSITKYSQIIEVEFILRWAISNEIYGCGDYYISTTESSNYDSKINSDVVVIKPKSYGSYSITFKLMRCDADTS